MEIQQVAIIGAGLMGTGITQSVAEAGYPVKWIDVSSGQLDKGIKTIRNLLNRKVEKGYCELHHIEDTMERIITNEELIKAKDVDLVIEAVPENMEIKKKIFRQLDEIINADAFLASNTSALSISALASVTRRPEKVIGTHFFYPVPKMGLLEVIPGLLTSQNTFESLKTFGQKIGKKAVLCKDFPGFIVNRLLVPMINEAIYLVMEGVKPEDVDSAMKIGANHPMGPLKLADFVGLETLLATMEGLYDGFKDSKYRPCPLLVKMVEAGTLGNKTGKGFYDHREKEQVL
ncbi:3-hydroxyacyl-CoA dehydrogenase family protein [Tuberibacillus sp. Marseille-P3662]|uniref:3-hydroxyacyl-CoA dehydrogenase family protein n=1 Tax=Tuberibacillus sp. Marseille-P3662 TaxID=1965358 RepID=UPI000A1CBB0F|nr:3-hydroxyacyl-CoA dehydrogenase NAD-binding domain-containing protein [Tuberibacillus sp. Marseille-P3662]